MSNESQISVVSPNGEVVGKIEVDIIPHDENGLEFDGGHPRDGRIQRYRLRLRRASDHRPPARRRVP